MKNNEYTTFKGYGINKIRGEYRAEAYANPSFYNTNLSKLKKSINAYLRGDNIVLESENNKYEIVNFKRNDKLYNTYVQKTSKLSGTYLGEAVFLVGCNKKSYPYLCEVKNLKFEM